VIAFTGVAMASVYMLRVFIRSMHNRLAANARSYDLTVRDGLVLVPLVVAIVAFALYPQQALEHSQPTVKRVVAAAAPGAPATAQTGATP
jgi:NADH-quinone oxidoreductase subunit M